jgi:spore coat polysaccharide biosynthesis protein SpsF
MLPFGGGSVLEHVLSRCSEACRPDVIAVATTDQVIDDVIARVCEARDTPVVRGSEHDVLDRYRQAIEELRLDVVVRVTADCPFVWCEDIDGVVAALIEAGPDADYAANQGCPDGLNVEASWAPRLRQAANDASDPYDREHVMPYLYRHGDRQVVRVDPAGVAADGAARLTLDTVVDYGLLSALRARADALGVRPSPNWLIDAVASPELAPWHDRAKHAATETAGAPSAPRRAGCTVCSILESLGSAAHQLGGGWVLSGNVDPRTARPALVLSATAHRDHLEELSDAEATFLGRNLRWIDPAMRAVTGAERIQVLLINEAGHIHLHLVPRYESDEPARFGPGLLNVPAPRGAPTPVAAAAAVVGQSR